MHPRPPGAGSKGQNIFLKVAMSHIKLKGMMLRAPCKHIFCSYIHQVKRNSECGHVAYQIKGKEVLTNIEAKTWTLHTPLTTGSGTSGSG